MIRRNLVVGAGALALLFLRPPAATFARSVGPTLAPVARLIQNVSGYIKEHPADPQGYFTLGRIHYFAFSQKTETISVLSSGTASTLPRPYQYQ